MFKRFILWDFRRGSWQYDVMVGLILAFIFLTPREVFRDGPRLPQIAMLPPENGKMPPFYVDPGVLKGVPENQRVAKLTEILHEKTGNRRLVITQIEPVLDSDGEPLGYMCFARQ